MKFHTMLSRSKRLCCGGIYTKRAAGGWLSSGLDMQDYVRAASASAPAIAVDGGRRRGPHFTRAQR